MEKIKSIARRMTEERREKTGKSDATIDAQTDEGYKRVKCMENVALSISEKVSRLVKAMDDITFLCRGIAEDYRTVTHGAMGQAPPEMVHMATELHNFGQELSQKLDDIKGEMKKGSFDNLVNYAREFSQIDQMNDDRKKKQLEYDFFRHKLEKLIQNELKEKDSTRIPRNEGLCEKWRQELYRSTESMKIKGNRLYMAGKKQIDLSLYTVCMGVGNFSGFALNSAKAHFGTIGLPSYVDVDIMPPKALPPPPAPHVPAAPPQPIEYPPLLIAQQGARTWAQSQLGYNFNPNFFHEQQQQPKGSGSNGSNEFPHWASDAARQAGAFDNTSASAPALNQPQSTVSFASTLLQPPPAGTTASSGAQVDPQRSSSTFNNNVGFGLSDASPPQMPANLNYGFAR